MTKLILQELPKQPPLRPPFLLSNKTYYHNQIFTQIFVHRVITESQNVLEGTLKVIQFQPPSLWQGDLPLHQAAQSPSQLVDGSSTTSLYNLSQFLGTLKNFFLLSNLDLHSFNFEVITTCLITACPVKSPILAFLQSLQVLKGALRSLWRLLFSKLNSLNSLNLSSHVRSSISSNIFVDLLCTSNISITLLYCSIQN